MLILCCKVVSLFQDCSSGGQTSVRIASFSVFTTKFPQRISRVSQRAQENVLVSETSLRLSADIRGAASPKNITHNLEAKALGS